MYFMDIIMIIYACLKYLNFYNILIFYDLKHTLLQFDYMNIGLFKFFLFIKWILAFFRYDNLFLIITHQL